MKSITQPPQRTKKQNHANIPCPIENCAKFTYGKLPDHLTKRHGLTGEEREQVNERQRKRFFNGELCQVKFLKESAIMELWGDVYNDPNIKNKIHEGYSMVKIRIIPITATTNRTTPLTEQDANILTNYNARTVTKPQKTVKRKVLVEEQGEENNSTTHRATRSKRRRTSCESTSTDGEENNNTIQTPSEINEIKGTEADTATREVSSCESDSSNYSYEIVSRQTETTGDERLQDLLDAKLDDKYKYIINDMKKSMTMGRTLSSKKQRTYRTYKRYAKRLIVYLQKQNPCSADDIDDLLGKQKYVSMFMDAMNNYFKPKTVRNYIIACIKLLDSRLFLIETDPLCKEKVAQLTLVYNLMHTYLVECMKLLPKKHRPTKEAKSDVTNSEKTAIVNPKESLRAEYSIFC